MFDRDDPIIKCVRCGVRDPAPGKSSCPPCLLKVSINTRKYHNENKVFIRKLKEKPCEECGQSFEWFMMDWDHADPDEKIAQVSFSFRWSRKRILNEIQKCHLLCVGCHRLRTISSVVTGTKQTKHRAARLRNIMFVNELKKAPCTDCGQSYDPILMDWDHVRGQKIVPISNACHRKWSQEKILTEIAKCDLTCCWCHRRRTQRRLVDEVA